MKTDSLTSGRQSCGEVPPAGDRGVSASAHRSAARPTASKMLADALHNNIVGMQAAWIEWQYGAGAEAAMRWIHNALAGPGFIPDENADYGKEPQAFYDANCADPLPRCACGRPSNIGWMGHGFCSEAHYEAASASGVRPLAQGTLASSQPTVNPGQTEARPNEHQQPFGNSERHLIPRPDEQTESGGQP